jgi:hypothetical protein
LLGRRPLRPVGYEDEAGSGDPDSERHVHEANGEDDQQEPDDLQGCIHHRLTAF